MAAPDTSLIDKALQTGRKYVLSPLGKILDFADTDLNVMTNLIRPAVTALNPKLNEVYDNAEKNFTGQPNVVPSDLIDKAYEDDPNAKVISKVFGFIADVGLSPTTYLAGIGGLTKSAKTLIKVKELTRTKTPILLDSAVGKDIAEMFGSKSATPELIRRARKLSTTSESIKIGASLEQQAAAGRRALVHIGIPFTNLHTDVISGELVFRSIDKTNVYLKNSQFGKAFNAVFSTSSGNPIFDGERLRAMSLARFRVENIKDVAKTVEKRIRDFAKQYGMERGEAQQYITSLAENEFHGNISAKSLLEVFGPNIDNQVVSGRQIKEIVDGLPGTKFMSMAERAKLDNSIMRVAKEKAAGFNTSTTGFLQIPLPIRRAFIETWQKDAGVKIAKTLGERKISYASIHSVIRGFYEGFVFVPKGKSYFGKLGKLSEEGSVAFTPGIDAALFQLVGPDEWQRLARLNALGKRRGVKRVVTEMDAAKDTVRRIISHVDQSFSSAYILHTQAPKALERASPRLAKIMKAISGNPDWKIKTLQEQYAFPLDAARRFPDALDIAQDVRAFAQTQLQNELDSGLHISQFIGNISYIPHVPSRAALKQLEIHSSGDFKGASSNWNYNHTNALSRKMRNIDPRKVEEAASTGKITRAQQKRILKGGDDAVNQLLREHRISNTNAGNLYRYLSVDEVNAMGKAGKLKILKGKTIENFFEINPARQIIIRGIKGEKARTSADFYNAARQFGEWHNVEDIAPTGKRFVKGDRQPLTTIRTVENKKGIKVQQRMVFDEGVAKHIDALHEALIVPTSVHPILKVFDGMQSEWKTWTLSVFPFYHTRNFIGNIWNNYLAGIHTPDPYIKALRVARKEKGFRVRLGSGQYHTSDELLQIAQESGITRSGQFFEEFDTYAAQDLSEGIAKLYKKTLRRFPDVGQKFGGAVEDNARLALFIRRLEEGHSVNSAVLEVKKYLFDYRNLTDAERQVLRRVFPFYSWTRFNVPLQLEALITHPARLMTVSKAQNALESNYDGVPDERLLPDWFAKSFPIRIRYDKARQRYEYLLLGGWLPAADIDKIFDPERLFLNQLSPILKEPIQQAANRDFFTGREIVNGEDAYETLRLFNHQYVLGAREAHYLKNIRLINEIHRFSDPEASTVAKVSRAVVGKLQPFDEDKQRIFAAKDFRRKISQLTSAYSRAILAGKEKEAQKILNRLNYIIDNKE